MRMLRSTIHATLTPPSDDTTTTTGSLSPMTPASTPLSSLSSMEKYLSLNGCFETQMGLDHRRDVIKSLNLLIRQAIQSLCLSQGMHWQYADRVGGKIVTYGSYKLEISHEGADIDALFLAPSHITREDYFTTFYSLFSKQRGITELRAIQDAFVPVIKMKYEGIEIDMTFARLNIPEIPHDLEVFHNCMLKGLDEKCIRSLNGFRSTIEIISLVPNIDVFRLCLRAIKHWAKCQGIYSNVMGYLGGFSWAALVAKACIIYPNVMDTEELVYKFFLLYSTWPWPKPVVLKKLENDQERESDYNMKSWNPDKNPTDKYQVMPIITPTYPHLNSTFNVSQSTLKLIQEKMCNAAKICEAILRGKQGWETLFKTRHIFHEFEHFLFVIASAYHPILWFGLIESKIRHFVVNIERECQSLYNARIWPKPYTQVKDGKTIQLWFVGLQFNSNASLDLTRPLQWFRDHLARHAHPFYTSDMSIYAELVHRAKVSATLTDDDIHEIISSSQHRNSQNQYHHHQHRDSNSSCCNNGSSSYASAVTSSKQPRYQGVSSGMVNPATIRCTAATNYPTQRMFGPMVSGSHFVPEHPSPLERAWTRGPNKSNMASPPATPGVPCAPVNISTFSRRNTDYDTDGLDASYSSMESDSCPRGSVSLSSDKFPPTDLIHARIRLNDTIPFSPGFISSPVWSPSPSSPSNINNNKQATFASATSRPMGLPTTHRVSASEIRDVPTPLPVHSVSHHPIRFNFANGQRKNSHVGSSTVLVSSQCSVDSVFP